MHCVRDASRIVLPTKTKQNLLCIHQFNSKYQSCKYEKHIKEICKKGTRLQSSWEIVVFFWNGGWLKPNFFLFVFTSEGWVEVQFMANVHQRDCSMFNSHTYASKISPKRPIFIWETGTFFLLTTLPIVVSLGRQVLLQIGKRNLWFYGFVVLWFHDFMVSWFHVVSHRAFHETKIQGDQRRQSHVISFWQI